MIHLRLERNQECLIKRHFFSTRNRGGETNTFGCYHILNFSSQFKLIVSVYLYKTHEGVIFLVTGEDMEAQRM